MVTSTSVNGRRRDLSPADEPLDWRTACRLLLACLIGFGVVMVIAAHL